MPMTKLTVIAIFILALAATGVWAQGRSSAISGRVTDQSGGAVSGARIEAIQTSTGQIRISFSSEKGLYRIPLLEVGLYRVIASKDGFKASRNDTVLLELDREAVVDHVLHIGDLTESVIISEQARAIEAAPSALTGLVDSRTIKQLPLNGRDYIQLATLQAGTIVDRARVSNAIQGYGLNISISGSRPVQNNFRLDGVSLNTYNGSTPGSINGLNLGVDAIQEFSVLTSAYSAQNGRAAGGVINAVTKAGSNEFHGGAFYFHRNDNLDARNFFDASEPPEFRRHQFGGSLGGPILTHKLFFFANYEGLREARGITTINTTLTTEARKGNLTGGTVKVDPVIAQAAALYPLPNREILGDTGLFSFANNVISNENFVTTRIDYALNDNDKLFARYSFDNGARHKESDFALGSMESRTRMQSAAIEETHIFSTNLLNAARIGFLRTYTIDGMFKSQVPATDDPSLAFIPQSFVVGPILVTGLTDFPGGTGAQPTELRIFDSYQFSDDLTWLYGRHSFKFGGVFERTHSNMDSQTRQLGDFQFKSIAKFLTNAPARFRAQLPGSDTIRGMRQWIGAFYLQDTWQASQRITLDFGVRWESASVPTEVNGKISSLDNLTDTSVRLGDPLWDNPSRKNFVPRVGLAWDIFGNGKTVIRSGYGIYPDLLLAHHLLSAGARNPPYFLRGETRSLSKGDFPKGGYPRLVSNPTLELRVWRFPRHPDQPYVQQWNLNIEQRLDRNSTFRVAYVGSHGVHLSSVTADANIATPITLTDGRLFFPENAARINPLFSRIRNHSFDAQSFYHALQMRLEHRIHHGFQLLASYCFSKSIDDSSNFVDNDEASNAAMLPVNRNPRFNRSLSSQDIRHYITGSVTWESPVNSGAGWHRLLGGWQLGGIWTYSSGMPTSVLLDYDAARTQTTETGSAISQRPDARFGWGGNLITHNPQGWVTAEAFSRPEPGFLGNLGRNTIIGPDWFDVDFSMVKTMNFPKLGKATTLDFRIEFFNLFNRTNFNLPDKERMAVFSEDSVREDFAKITSAGRSREIQMGLRLRF
jgi:hypothetical protein